MVEAGFAWQSSPRYKRSRLERSGLQLNEDRRESGQTISYANLIEFNVQRRTVQSNGQGAPAVSCFGAAAARWQGGRRPTAAGAGPALVAGRSSVACPTQSSRRCDAKQARRSLGGGRKRAPPAGVRLAEPGCSSCAVRSADAVRWRLNERSRLPASGSRPQRWRPLFAHGERRRTSAAGIWSRSLAAGQRRAPRPACNRGGRLSRSTSDKREVSGQWRTGSKRGVARKGQPRSAGHGRRRLQSSRESLAKSW